MSVLFIYFFSDILKKKKKQGLLPQGKVVIGCVVATQLYPSLGTWQYMGSCRKRVKV